MAFIDRDAPTMMKYSKDVQVVISDMILIIRKVEGVLDYYSHELDTITQEEIKKLHTACDKFLKEIDHYQGVADSIYFKGKKLNDIRNGG